MQFVQRGTCAVRGQHHFLPGLHQLPRSAVNTAQRLLFQLHLGLRRIGNESVPTQLAQCWFPGLAFSNAKI